MAPAQLRRYLVSVFFLQVLSLSSAACATSHPAGIYDGRSGQPTRLEHVLGGVQPGQAVIVSENHGFAHHHRNQVSVLRHIASRMPKVSVGMELFDLTQQEAVDKFLSGAMAEAEFLQVIGWKGLAFSHYREQVLFPRQSAGATVALNAPRALTGAVARKGLSGLSEEERRLLPPGFTLGNEIYRERFAKMMGEHVPPDKIQNYFEAQSVWDETMAWRAGEFLRARPDQVLVIIVGDFHAAFGGGLPDRLRARGVAVGAVISQINRDELDLPSLAEAIGPHPRWGPRAEGVWLEP